MYSDVSRKSWASAGLYFEVILIRLSQNTLFFGRKHQTPGAHGKQRYFPDHFVPDLFLSPLTKVQNARNEFRVQREPVWRAELGSSHVSPAACHFTFGNLYLASSCTAGGLGRCHSRAKLFKADRCPFTSGVLKCCLIQRWCSGAADTFAWHHRFLANRHGVIGVFNLHVLQNWIQTQTTRIRRAPNFCCDAEEKQEHHHHLHRTVALIL